MPQNNIHVIAAFEFNGFSQLYPVALVNRVAATGQAKLEASTRAMQVMQK